MPRPAHASAVRSRRGVVVLYGVLARSLKWTWAHIRETIVAPLEAAGFSIELIGFDVDVGDMIVDGVTTRDRRSLFTTDLGSSSDRSRSAIGRGGSPKASSPPFVPLSQLFSMPQAKIDEKLKRLCGASAPGCVPARLRPIGRPNQTHGRYTPTGAGRTVLCAPLVSDLVYPMRMDEMKKLYASDAAALKKGIKLMKPYHELAMINAYRQLHTEWRVGQYLRARGDHYGVAVAITADAVPLVNLSAAEVMGAAADRRVLLTSDQNDKQGYTNGFVAGHPDALARVLMRLQDVVQGRMPTVATMPTDYEGLFKAAFDLHAIQRRVTCMRFIKVRANGKLAYTKCLGNRRLKDCTGPGAPLRPFTDLPYCPHEAEKTPHGRRLATVVVRDAQHHKPAQHKPLQHKPAQHKPLQHKPAQHKPAQHMQAQQLHCVSPQTRNTLEFRLLELRAQVACAPREASFGTRSNSSASRLAPVACSSPPSVPTRRRLASRLLQALTRITSIFS